MADSTRRVSVRLSLDDAARVKAELREVGETGQRSLERIQDGADKASRALSLMDVAVRGAQIAGVAVAARALVQAGDALTQSLFRLQTATGSVERAGAVYEALYRNALQTGVAVSESVDAFQRFSIAAREIGATSDQVVRLVAGLQRVAIVSGASNAEIGSATLQLAQALASGVLQGDELRSILEAMPLLAEGLAREQGGVLVDEGDDGLSPRLLVYLEHAIRDGRVAKSGEPRAVSQRLQFIHLREDGTAADGGPAPYLDCRPITAEERDLVSDAITAPWLSGRVEQQALGYAIAKLVPEHLGEVKRRRLAEIDKVEREVRSRLTREINYWDARAARLRGEERAGKEQRINASNAEATAQRLVERLHKRQEELARERQITALPPVMKGAALIIPKGLLVARSQPTRTPVPAGFAEDATSRAEVERLAMEAVMAAERALGHVPRDVSAEKKGWDIESRDVKAGHLRFLEVKGRHVDGDVIMLTKNELLASLNSPEAFILAIVLVKDGFAREPVYVRRFFQRELGFGETAIAFNVNDLLSLGLSPDQDR